MAAHILAIDQGTTSTRAMIFSERGERLSMAQRALTQHYPELGWVEHDPEEIWRATIEAVREAIVLSGVEIVAIAAIGITNQRETSLIWDRATGQPIHRAIVWQDRRTAQRCADLKAQGAETEVQARTGLLLDPYFSGTKIGWLLDLVPGARARAERGELAFGTIDSFLLWRLTGGTVHATDVTNASRTLLWNLREECWDAEMCRLLGVPVAMLPAVHGNAHPFGETDRALFGRGIPVLAMAGDQQAALFGQACFAPGSLKITYGTGGFALLNTGEEAIASRHRLLTTPAYRISERTIFALEGSIFIAGAAIQWLREGLGIIADAGESGALAPRIADDHGVYLVPAFVGLGAPHWDAEARGAIVGLTLDTGPAHLARAALEAVGYQTLDLLDAMVADGAALPAIVRVDGGMAANDWLCQFLAGLLEAPVERPRDLESTARGVAFMAGLAAGFWPDLAAIEHLWAQDRRFDPAMAQDHRADRIAGWRDALRRVRS